MSLQVCSSFASNCSQSRYGGNTSIWRVGSYATGNENQILAVTEPSPTHVLYLYLIIASLLAIPGISFMMLYLRNKAESSIPEQLANKSTFRCSFSTLMLLASTALINMLLIGIQCTYGNLLMAYAVLGPLKMSKSMGTYLTTVLWTAMCFGNING